MLAFRLPAGPSVSIRATGKPQGSSCLNSRLLGGSGDLVTGYFRDL